MLPKLTPAADPSGSSLSPPLPPVSAGSAAPDQPPTAAGEAPAAQPPSAAAARAAAREAMGWLHGARFLTTASKIEQLQPNELPEIAFVGRSNAGKSTAINTLTQQRRLAFASRTPGRTQHINLFEVGPREAPDAWLADLPGYGYAAVSRDAKARWQEEMARYLQQRRSLSGLVLMVDSRLGLTELDRQLLTFVEPRLRSGEVRLLVLLTKRDKLNRREADAVLARTGEELGAYVGESSDLSLTLFSALSKAGVEDVAQVLHSWRKG